MFPDIDGYISQFEELARQAGYTNGNLETTQLFLSGLDRSTLEGVLRPPFAHRYQAIKEHAIESTRSTQLVHSIISQPKEIVQPKAQVTTKTHINVICFHCKQKGHIACYCPTRRKQTNLIDIEEEISPTSISPLEDVRTRLASLTTAQQNQLAKGMSIQEDPLHCLLRSALLRQNQDEDVYISARKSMTVRFYIHSITKRAESVALLDSGATENFMNLSYAKWLRLPIKQLE